MGTEKRRRRCGFAVTALGLGLALTACGSAPSTTAIPTDQAVATAFVTKVVEPNHAELVQRIAALQLAVQQLATGPTDARLAAAREAWLAARRPWETSESWAFGPAETEGFDGAMDDWPVNRKDLALALAGAPLTADTFDRLSATAKGFHGLEWVLFGGRTGVRPSAAQLTANETAYLRLAADDLHRQALGLQASWAGPTGFGARITTAAEAGTAVQEMLQGVIGLLQEEGDEKLGEPLRTRDPKTLESADSGNTQADLLANVEGARQVLVRTGLLELIRRRDAPLAGQIDTQTAKAVALARALPHPIHGHLADPASREAMGSLIRHLHSTAQLLERSALLLS